MKSNSELIQELQREAASGNWYGVGLIVAFSPEQGREDDAITTDLANPLASLNEAVNSGGNPIGFIFSVVQDNRLTIRTRILPQHEDNPLLRQRLIGWANGFHKALDQTGIANNLWKGGQA